MTRTRAATEFLTSHARLLDRRRQAAVQESEASARERAGAAVIGALEAYRNDDGGYGWGLEPDLRSPESQVAGGASCSRSARGRGARPVPGAAGAPRLA